MTDASRGPADLERETERTRADVDEDLRAIADRLAPERALRSALDYFHGQGGDWILQRIRDNPVAAAMTVVGIGWLLLGGRRAPSRHVFERKQYRVTGQGQPWMAARPEVHIPEERSQAMPSRTLTALYDRRADAEAVAEDLVRAGIPRVQISLVDNTAATMSTDRRSDDGGFLEALRDFFLPDEDRYTYAEGIRRGGTLLTVRVGEDDAERAIDILERAGAVDLDTRVGEWRSAGWAGYEAGVGRKTEAVIPVVEEELQVGKREVERGGVRVRSYIVETPVEEQVTLREEHVRIERRPVDRPVGAGDAGLFREKTIEVTETGEEAVVAKTARVKEELVIHKDVEQRTERVAGTVRRTEVEVEDTRTGKTSTTSGRSTRTS